MREIRWFSFIHSILCSWQARYSGLRVPGPIRQDESTRTVKDTGCSQAARSGASTTSNWVTASHSALELLGNYHHDG